MFKNMIYVLDNSELKKIILREFLVKSYSGHPPKISEDFDKCQEVLLLAKLEEIGG